MDALQLERATEVVSRNLRLYEIVPEKSDGLVVFCRTSASMPFVSLSKKGMFIFHDLRFFDLLHHAVLGLQFFDTNIDLPTGKTMGRFHLDSLLWTRLAESSLNINTEDLALALGLLTQESMHYEHSLRTMGVYAPQLKISGYKAFFNIEIFQSFALGHELAHFNFKTGEKWNDKDMKTFWCVLDVIDKQAEDLQSKPIAPHPAILHMIIAVQKIRSSKILFEEILADIASINSMFSTKGALSSLNLDKGIALIASTVLYGLAGAKILAYTRAFAAKNREDFENIWLHNHELFDARITFIVKFFSVLLYSQPEGSLSESPEKTDHSIYLLLYDIFESVRRAESSLKPTFERIIELRGNGEETINEEALESNTVFSICANKLGWKE